MGLNVAGIVFFVDNLLVNKLTCKNLLLFHRYNVATENKFKIFHVVKKKKVKKKFINQGVPQLLLRTFENNRIFLSLWAYYTENDMKM